jgi:hypothetical protein
MQVRKNWKGRLKTTSEYRSYDIDKLRVRTCVEIALRCVEKDLIKRPCIEDIVHELEELEAEINKRIMSVPLEESKVLIPQVLTSIIINQNHRMVTINIFGGLCNL